jgi:hypothetical protein
MAARVPSGADRERVAARAAETAVKQRALAAL